MFLFLVFLRSWLLKYRNKKQRKKKIDERYIKQIEEKQNKIIRVYR